jgi:hypothetical protein
MNSPDTTDETDPPAALPAIQAPSFENLLAVIANPKERKARLAELDAKMEAVTAAEAKVCRGYRRF